MKYFWNHSARKAAVLCAVVATSCMGAQAPANAPSSQPFTIYGYIVYPLAQAGTVTTPHLPDYAAPAYGIHAINLVYEGRLLDVDKAHPNDARINLQKIDSIARDAATRPNELVSLDMESWKRFDKEHTPALYEQVLKEFHKVNPKSRVGLYATVPQVTYGWQPDMAAKYDPLNAAYKSVAAQVDYFSPSLYNWEHALEPEEWARAAEYAIKAAHAYDASKPVLPYLTPQVTRDGKTSFLTYDQMLFRLRTLHRLGADGCILWTGTAGSQKFGGTLDPQQGWGKAIVDFQRELHTSNQSVRP